jgi:HTH-type transcriptional regulator / antitoxin HipB
MSVEHKKLPVGHIQDLEATIRSSTELGVIVRAQRKRLALTQLDVAGVGNTGNRFVVELEGGKPTLQLQKVLDVIDLLGLELIVRAKSGQKL